MRDFRVTPYICVHTTDAGDSWEFRYMGTSYIKIYPALDSKGAEPGAEWTKQIGLDDYGMRPDSVTGEWLEGRFVAWIADRNEEDAAKITETAGSELIKEPKPSRVAGPNEYTTLRKNLRLG